MGAAKPNKKSSEPVLPATCALMSRFVHAEARSSA